MNSSWSRRGFLSALAVTGASGAETKLPAAPSEVRRLRDPATEFELLRLTDPAKYSAILPAPPLRAVTRNNGLIYCCDRSGSMQVWRMSVRSGQTEQVTRAEALKPASVTLLADDRSLAWVDGSDLMVGAQRTRSAYTLDGGWQFAGNFSVADDGNTAALSEQKDGRYRLRVVPLNRGGTPSTLFEAGEPLRYCRVRPKRPGILYNHNGVLTLVNPDGRGSKRLNVPGGLAGFALWTLDGRAIEYLSVPKERGQVQLREHYPETGEDKLIGNTTQFVSFARNTDSSVFAGISGSKAGPFVLLLVRAGRREMTLAEHKASAPENAVVAFSANSQRLFYATDREGRPAIYSIGLEQFVEDTEASDDAAASQTKQPRRRW